MEKDPQTADPQQETKTPPKASKPWSMWWVVTFVIAYLIIYTIWRFK
jgi:hypothetical protein